VNLGLVLYVERKVQATLLYATTFCPIIHTSNEVTFACPVKPVLALNRLQIVFCFIL